MNRLDIINTAIKTIAGAEKITKKVLGEVSRTMLEYVVNDEAWDSAAINRLLAVLTPMNKKTAVLYFSHFLPFVVEEGHFGAMPKDKQAKKNAKLKSVNLVTEFLVDEENNIWTWAEQNVKVEQKDIDYAKRVTSAVNNAMAEDKGGLGLADVLEAVMAAGISTDDVIKAMSILAQEGEEEAKAA